MPAPTTAADLLELIRKSAVISKDKLEDFQAQAGLPEDAKELAKVLVQRKLLTAFQVKLLLAGRYKGFRLGSYLLLDQIGQGGMGAVYLAEHETLRRKAAIKVLPPGGNKLTIERFLREARSAAALDHPNIVRLHEAGREGEVHFLAMEYVEGQPFDKLVAENGPMAVGKAVEYIAQAAAGLQHAHEKGFIHRDIKPGNLILTPDGTVKILDMGLARSTDQNDQLTEMLDAGAVVGTADYISPEQAINSPKIDIRTDIYSLGATFYAIVTGKPPFDGPTASKLLQHQMKDAPSLTKLDRTFPPKLAQVVARMMAKKPEDRYQTPAELIDALEPWLNDSTKLLAALTQTEAGTSGKIDPRSGRLLTRPRPKALAKPVESESEIDPPAKATPPAKKKSPAVLLAIMGAMLMVFVAVGVTTAVLLGGGSSSQSSQTTPTQPSQNNPTTPSTTPGKTSDPVEPKDPVKPPPPPQPKVLYSLNASDLPAFRVVRERRNKVEGGGDEKLPKGVYCQSYRMDSKGEFRLGDYQGKKALSLVNLTEQKFAQYAFDLETGIGVKLETSKQYTLTIEYRTQNGGNGQVYIQNQTPDKQYLKVAEIKLVPATDSWTTKTVTFSKPENSTIRFVIDNLATGPTDWVYFSRVTITELPDTPQN